MKGKYDMIVFKGTAITNSGDYWHVDFLEFTSLYAAKGYILRKIKV